MLNRLSKYLLLLAIFFNIANAQTAKLETNLSEGAVGDILELKIIVETNGAKLAFPVLEKSYGALELFETSKIDTLHKNGTLQLSQIFKVIALDSGLCSIPQLEVKFDNFSIFTNSIDFKIKSQGADGKKAIRDIKPPLSASEETSVNYTKYAIITAIVLAFCLLIFFLLRRKGGRKEAPSNIHAPARVLAIAALNELKDSDYINDGKFKELYVRISDILRTFIQMEFQFHAKTLLTEDILVAYSKKTRDIESIALLRAVLELSDLVKFAKRLPSAEEANKSIDMVIQFIERNVVGDFRAN